MKLAAAWRRGLRRVRYNQKQKRRGTYDSYNSIANRHGSSSFWKKLESLHYWTRLVWTLPHC